MATRHMLSLPVDSGGEVGCILNLQGRDAPLRVAAERMRIQLAGEPRYIEHVHPD
ncbi:MAG: hypothetical protein GWO16_14180 [Gammaproteobacteria bacterium]|nr:hypothetical protein [Gammaproteobacteria bacterium]NIR99077.1 hypothetical protein [Gammaproteobacteria bacterium]NIT64709.1 hypothetical protein [Gammaproteobacteria bacterium]NIV21667.1 hypothetical protein [Gammaproteobacteria bacterium]NIX10629.1 hypothetical protein [Gammaproteobacteria bacterium]